MFRLFKKKRIETQNDNGDLEIDMNNIPKHVAIIMDGNGRWAKARNLPRTMGHKAGVEAIIDILKEADKLGIKYVTLYAFSTENWKRPKDEVNAIMKLLVQYLKLEIDEMDRNGVVIKVIGDISKLPKECIDEINIAMKRTQNNSGVVMNIALNYGGRDEILRAVKNIIKDQNLGKIAIDSIDEKLISDYMYTNYMPDPDIIIRPSGEQRLSNFLLWQCAYSEFWYSNINWPDFSPRDLRMAIVDYQKRNRRFGAIKS